jgi:hypothetical protein
MLPHFLEIGLQMAVRLPVLHAGRPLLPGKLTVLISIGKRGRVVVKTLCYTPEERGFETRSDEYIF